MVRYNTCVVKSVISQLFVIKGVMIMTIQTVFLLGIYHLVFFGLVGCHNLQKCKTSEKSDHETQEFVNSICCIQDAGFK